MAALGGDHGGELFQPTKAYKNKCKKFRKAAEKGGVNTAAALAECVQYGVAVEPRLQWPATPSPQPRPMTEIHSLVLSLLQVRLSRRVRRALRFVRESHISHTTYPADPNPNPNAEPRTPTPQFRTAGEVHRGRCAFLGHAVASRLDRRPEPRRRVTGAGEG